MNSLRSYFRSAIMLFAAAFALAACDVHEIPEPEKLRNLTIDLDFNTELPLYQVLEHQATRAEQAENYDIRYVVNIYNGLFYNASTERQILRQIVRTQDDIDELDYSFEIDNLPYGYYTIMVWADYVDAGSDDDKFYNTADFAAIKLHQEHVGNNDYRDAFVGRTSIRVSYATSRIPIHMKRPLAKYNFITTDLNKFVERIIEMRAEAEAKDKEANNKDKDGSNSDKEAKAPIVLGKNQVLGTTKSGETRVVDLNDFNIVFTYHGNMADEYEMFLDNPIEARATTFSSTLTKISDTEAELGFDYVFVNGDASAVNVSVDIYDKDGTLLSTTDAFKVPISRSKLTTVRSKFLTSEASGGVGINPGFEDDEYIYEP
ncbi:MAG: FimB/Mfa2 family fimbrial subunit [Alistipes sp.]|nr:FimB/Mfa2 family fimbrial subunit [Alistipes sp.]